MNLVQGIFYAAAAMLWMAAFLAAKKSETVQSLAAWAAGALFGYELYACAVGGLMTILHIPADILTIGAADLAAAAAVYILCIRPHGVQKYSLKPEDIAALLVFAGAAAAVGLQRFAPGWIIAYETSDPARHLQMALDCVRQKTAVSTYSGMIVGPFTNALTIEMLSFLFPGTLRYRIFILKDLYNFFMAGALFYACLRRRLNRPLLRWLGIGMGLLYMLGYPLSNLLFGFVYLGLGVNAAAFLILAVDLYVSHETDSRLALGLVSLGCMGSGLSYTLFAPLVFVSVFCLLTWDFVRRNKPLLQKENLVHFVQLQLYTFLLPTLYTLYFVVYFQLGRNVPLGEALTYEGYIYRNLYTDFLLFLPLAVIGLWATIRGKKWQLCTAMAPLGLAYCLYFFREMVHDRISTYYYYKLNYLVWLIVLVLAMEGIVFLSEKALSAVVSWGLCTALVFFMAFSGHIEAYYNKNNLYMPLQDNKGMVHIYETNEIYLLHSRDYADSLKLVDLCAQLGAYASRGDAAAPFIGDELHSGWYEALTDQRFSPEDAYGGGAETPAERFLQGDACGDYIVVWKDSDEYEEAAPILDRLAVVYRNDAGYIAKKY